MKAHDITIGSMTVTAWWPFDNAPTGKWFVQISVDDLLRLDKRMTELEAHENDGSE